MTCIRCSNHPRGRERGGTIPVGVAKPLLSHAAVDAAGQQFVSRPATAGTSRVNPATSRTLRPHEPSDQPAVHHRALLGDQIRGGSGLDQSITSPSGAWRGSSGRR